MKSQATAYEKQLRREIRNTPQEYWPHLLLIVRAFRESVALNPAEESFRQGWKEMLAGETRPVSELWTDIASE